MIKAQVIADSRNQFGNRLITMIITFPRYILSEFNTHRMFSKNSASSRAIPFEKLLRSVKKTPFVPIAWQKNHPGMQGTEYCTPREAEVLTSAHLVTRDRIIEQVEYMAKYANPTKQLLNRYLEFYMYHTCIVSFTEEENFFALRCPQYYVPNTVAGEPFHNITYRSWKDLIEALSTTTEGNYEGSVEAVKSMSVVDRLQYNKGAADIHMMSLAEAMWDAYNKSTPKLLQEGEWHIPYLKKILDKFGDSEVMLGDGTNSVPWAVRVSTMMCARVSYTTIGEEGGEWTLDKYLQKHDALVHQKPIHASPLEHCAKCMGDDYDSYINGHAEFSLLDNDGHGNIKCAINDYDKINGWSGNFRGFIQYRKMIPNENVTTNGSKR